MLQDTLIQGKKGIKKTKVIFHHYLSHFKDQYYCIEIMKDIEDESIHLENGMSFRIEMGGFFLTIESHMQALHSVNSPGQMLSLNC